MSVRTLAKTAEVSGSTITRIQGHMVDPTLHTVEQIIEAAGFELQFSVVRQGTRRTPRLGDLGTAWSWSSRRGQVRVDWPRWRTLLDHLALHPEHVPEAIYSAPLPSGSPVVDSLLAGVAEKIADDALLPRPVWTESTPGLDQPFQPPVRPGVLLAIPPQLSARGLMIDTESLWRDRRTIGV